MVIVVPRITRYLTTVVHIMHFCKSSIVINYHCNTELLFKLPWNLMRISWCFNKHFFNLYFTIPCIHYYFVKAWKLLKGEALLIYYEFTVLAMTVVTGILEETITSMEILFNYLFLCWSILEQLWVKDRSHFLSRVQCLSILWLWLFNKVIRYANFLFFFTISLIKLIKMHVNRKRRQLKINSW